MIGRITKLIFTFRKQNCRLVRLPMSNFAQLSKNTNLDQAENVKEYYQILLKLAKPTTTKRAQIDKMHLLKMINLSQSVEDINLTVSAYFNFLGYHTSFSQTSIDGLCIKAVEYGATDRVIEIFENHTSLMYFPHPRVSEKLLDNLIEKNDNEQIIQFFNAIFKNRLLQTNDVIVTQGCEFAASSGNVDLAVKIIDLFGKRKELKGNTDQNLAALASCLSKYNEQNDKAETVSPAENSVFDFVKKSGSQNARVSLNLTLAQLKKQNFDEAIFHLSEVSPFIKSFSEANQDFKIGNEERKFILDSFNAIINDPQNANNSIQITQRLKKVYGDLAKVSPLWKDDQSKLGNTSTTPETNATQQNK